MLEVIDRGSTSHAHPAPLLFVHGAWHSAACWDEHFLAFFADKGYQALAVSLRGHGKSSAPKSLRRCSIRDYVDDIAMVARRLPRRPVVIGHSMGGFIVQKYLELHDAPAAVLLASAPPRGALGFMLREVAHHPWRITRSVLTMKTLHGVATLNGARQTFFTATTPEHDVLRYAAQLQEEYIGRCALDFTFLDLPRPDRVTTPLLVLGAEHDGCFTVEEIHATAHAYCTQAAIFPGMGHDMMLESDWTLVTRYIDEWVNARGL